MYSVFAYYRFCPIEDPAQAIQEHKTFLSRRDAKGRIYLSEEGINGQMSLYEKDAEVYTAWLHEQFPGLSIKIHSYFEHVFPRLTIKYRRQLAALDVPVDLSQTAPHLPPKEWKARLDAKRANTLLLDVRNHYEWTVGHFKGAHLPPLEQFRQFPAYAETLKTQWDPDTTTVLMYCTGGIRCEMFSPHLKSLGFKEIYQLEGGVIQYGQEIGQDHWEGKLFVFDDRLVVPLGHNAHPTISTCLHCHTPTDLYYNCANMDCNTLFLACSACHQTLQGCCCPACTQAPRVRPCPTHPKPFRRLKGSAP